MFCERCAHRARGHWDMRRHAFTLYLDDRGPELGEVVSDVPICSRIVSAKLDALDRSFAHNIRCC